MFEITYQKVLDSAGQNESLYLRKVQPIHHFVSVSLAHERELNKHLKHLNIFLELTDGSKFGEHTFGSEKWTPVLASTQNWKSVVGIAKKTLVHLKNLHSEGFALLDLGLSHCWLSQDGEIRFSNALRCRRLDEWGKVIYFDQESEERDLYWNHDLYGLGKILQELSDKIKERENEDSEESKAVKKLIQKILNPQIEARGESISHVMAEFNYWLSDETIRIEIPKDVDSHLNQSCGAREQHRLWFLRKMCLLSILNYDWETHWSFQFKWEPFVLPDEVIEELARDIKNDTLKLDELMMWMLCSKRGLPFKILAHLGFPKIMENPREVLDKWLACHVFSIEGDRCIWGHSKLYEILVDWVPQNELVEKSKSVIAAFKETSIDDLSMMSQVISLVQEQKNDSAEVNPKHLWSLHYKALKKYIWLEDWESAFTAIEWLWVHRKHSDHVDEFELALYRVDCWMALKQDKLALDQLQKLNSVGFTQDFEVAKRKVELWSQLGQESDSKDLVLEQLSKYEVPWISKGNLFSKFTSKTKHKKTTPKIAKEILQWISLLESNSTTWKEQLIDFEGHFSSEVGGELKELLALQKFKYAVANLDSSMLQASLTVLNYSEIKVMKSFTEVESLGYEWVRGAPVDVVLDKISKWLNVPVRRIVPKKNAAISLNDVIHHLVYGKEMDLSGRIPTIYDLIYLALTKNWGAIYNSLNDQSLKMDYSLENLLKKFLWSISAVFANRGDFQTRSFIKIWETNKKEFEFFKHLEPDVSGTFLFMLQMLEQKTQANKEFSQSDIDLISSLYMKQNWKLIATVFMTALEDMMRLGWVQAEFNWVVEEDRFSELGYWGLLGQKSGSWIYQKDDPILIMLHELSKAEDHEQRIQCLLKHLLSAAGGTHACCWISWGEDWLPCFKWSSVEAKHGWQNEPVAPSLRGDRIEHTSLNHDFMDQFLCRIEGRSRTFVIGMANDTYQHCFSIKQYELVSKMLEYTIEPIENELALDWSKKYLNKLLPEDHPAYEITKESSGLPPLEDLEQKLNKVVEGLQEEKNDMAKKNQAWMQQVHEEMKKHDQLQSLGRLVASLAHEINNPNSFIKINAPMVMQLWQQYLNPSTENPLPQDFIKERIPALLNTIEEGADRIDHLIQDLKNFARQNHDESMHVIHLRDIVDSAMRMNKKYIDQHTTNFSLEIAEGLPSILGVSHRIEQVIVNLIHNACDALSDINKSIRISLYEQDDKVVFKIIDEGCGMSDATQNSIFEPFYTTKDQSHGMGMGMTVVKNILDHHQAQIEIQSKEGEGTTFFVYFKAYENHE